MNDPIEVTRKINAALPPANRFVMSTGDSTKPDEVKVADAQNAAVLGIMTESPRAIGDSVRIAIGGGPVLLELASASGLSIGSFLISDNVGRGIPLPVTSAITNVGARIVDPVPAGTQFVSVLPVNFKTKY